MGATYIGQLLRLLPKLMRHSVYSSCHCWVPNMPLASGPETVSNFDAEFSHCRHQTRELLACATTVLVCKVHMYGPHILGES